MSERSYFAFDRAWLAEPRAPTAEDPAWAAHRAAVEDPGPLPDWARALPPRRSAPMRRWLPPAVLGVVALAAVALAGVLWTPEAPNYIGVKGDPAIVLHLRDGEVGLPWDGDAALGPGEALRLELVGFRQPWVAVLFEEPDGTLAWVTSGPRPERGLLPGAWELDASARGARLIVLGLPFDPSGRAIEDLLREPTAERAALPLR